MSIYTTVTIDCDRCGFGHELFAETEEGGEIEARQAGWSISPQADICPTCLRDLADEPK